MPPFSHWASRERSGQSWPRSWAPQDSSTIGCGLGRFEACAFPWRLTYDECLFVVSGEMEILSEGRAYHAGAGDSLFLPKGIDVEYRFREPCLLFYATYPVNWAATRQEDLDG